MYEFNYHRAASVENAIELAGGFGDPKFLAGGQTLIPAMKTRLAAPSDLIDLGRIDDLKGITADAEVIVIGAGATHYEISVHEGVRQHCPALAFMAGHVGDAHVRHKGTMGGSLANNDPAADYPAAILALGAVIVTNGREIPAEEFFTGLFETALEEGEIITAIRIPVPSKAGYCKFRNPASRYAMTGVFVALTKDGARVGVTGAGDDGVFRATEIEAALDKSFDASSIDGIEIDPGSLMTDMHASAEYRANLVTVMAMRAVDMASG